MKDIAAVVVTYNRKKLLVECIESLKNQTEIERLDIIIIDNNSTDGTKETICNYIDNNDIIYHNTGENLGGAGGFQYGIKYAASQKYKYVWVMDDDCIPNNDALEKFLNFSSNKKEYGFLSSKVLWKDGSICTMNKQRKTMFSVVRDFDNKYETITMASFVSLFIPMSIVYEVGLPIKEFFIWTDDWEYTRRISLKYPCYLVNDSIVVHKSAFNIGANIANDAVERLGRYDYLYRNDVYLYRREGMSGFCYEFIRLMMHIVRVIFVAKNYKFKRIEKIIHGTLSGVNFNPEIEYVKSI